MSEIETQFVCSECFQPTESGDMLGFRCGSCKKDFAIKSEHVTQTQMGPMLSCPYCRRRHKFEDNLRTGGRGWVLA